MGFPNNTSVIDTFDRANGPLGSNWAGWWGDSIATIASNKMHGSAGVWTSGYWTASTFGPDSEVYCTILNASTASRFYLIVRMTNPAAPNCYTMFNYNGEFLLASMTNGVGTNLLYVAHDPPSSGDQVGLSAVGSLITMWYKPSGGSWTEVGHVNDTTYTNAGYIGVEFTDSIAMDVDDFSGGTIISSTSPTIEVNESSIGFYPVNPSITLVNLNPAIEVPPGVLNLSGVSPLRVAWPLGGWAEGAEKTRYIPPITGDTFYVSTTGNNANPGTENSPWRTLTYAISQAGPGDRVYIRSGQYAERPYFSSSGTAGNYIQFMAYPGETVIFDSRDLGWSPGSGNSHCRFDASYIFFSGFEVRYSNDLGVVVPYPQHHVIIDNCYVHHTWENGILISGNYCIVQNCEIYYCARQNSPENTGTKTGFWASGCSFTPGYTGYNSTNGILRNCYAHSNWGEGLSMWIIDYPEMYDNIVCNSYSTNIYVSSMTHGLVTRNFSYYNPSEPCYGTSGSEVSLMIGDEPSCNYPSSNVEVSNNITMGGTRCIYYWGEGKAGDTISNIQIINNTAVNARPKSGNDSACVQISPGVGINSGIVFRNNLCVQDNPTGLTLGAFYVASGVASFDHNCWSTASAPSNAGGTGDIVNYAGGMERGINGATVYQTEWYRPAEDSQVIDAGSITLAPLLDYRRVTRSSYSPLDIGAIEYAVYGNPLSINANVESFGKSFSIYPIDPEITSLVSKWWQAYWNASFSQNQEVYITCSHIAGIIRLWGRLVNPENYGTSMRGYFAQYDGSELSVHRYNDVGLIDIPLGLWQGSLVDGNKIWLRLENSNIKVYTESGGVWTLRIDVADSSPYLEAGYIGFDVNNSLAEVDDFGGGNLGFPVIRENVSRWVMMG